MAPHIPESTFATLEKQSKSKQHAFIAQYKDQFKSKPIDQNVKKGDHLRWTGSGKSYHHHAVVTEVGGDDIKVAENTGPIWGFSAVSQSTLSSDSGRLGGIKETTFPLSVLTEKNAEVIVWPKCLKRFSPEEIVERAERRVGENHYDLTRNNCEHFVTWCICGLKVSLQVKTWLVVLREFVSSMLPRVPVIAANLADEIFSFFKNCLPWIDAFFEAGIAVYELYKVYQQYKEGKYESRPRWDVLKDIILILMKGILRFGLVYLGLTYVEKVLQYMCPSFLRFTSGNSDKAGGLIEGAIALYEIKKAWDQWWNPKCVLISTGWEFTVKVIEILSKGCLRFGLGYLGSKYSDEIFEKIGEYLNPLSGYLAEVGTKWGTKIFEKIGEYLRHLLEHERFKSSVCGAVGGCLGHYAGAAIAWISENWFYIFNSG